MKSTKILWATLIVIGIIAVGGYFFPQVRAFGGGSIDTVLRHFAGGLQAGRGDQFKIDNQGNITQSYDGFVLWDDFVVGTTSPVRGSVVNTTGSTLYCDGKSLGVVASSTASFAPSFKYVVGTTTSNVASTPTSLGYSANLISSTTVATTTLHVVSLNSGWGFLLPVGQSITVSVGDNVNNASSTFYGNWSAQFSVSCRNLGQ